MTVVVVGQGRLVGKPITKMLKDSGSDVIACDEDTKDLAAETRKADIIITATGVAGLIKHEMVKDHAVIIDAGTSRVDGKLVGDVASEVFENETLSITPSPGGVGPMTVAVLFENLLRAAQRER